MGIQTFNLTGTIALPITAASGSEIVTVYDGALKTNSSLVKAESLVSVNSFIKGLKLMAAIASVDPAAMPNFSLGDSQTDKLYKTLDTEWKSPRKQVDLFIKNGSSDWLKVFAISLLNPLGYPFRVYSLMDAYTDGLAVELGSDGKIGLAMKDVGFGLLAPKDIVTVYGSWVQEIVLLAPDIPVTINVNGGSVTPQTSPSTGPTPPSTGPTPPSTGPTPPSTGSASSYLIDNLNVIDNNFTFQN